MKVESTLLSQHPLPPLLSVSACTPGPPACPCSSLPSSASSSLASPGGYPAPGPRHYHFIKRFIKAEPGPRYYHFIKRFIQAEPGPRYDHFIKQLLKLNPGLDIIISLNDSIKLNRGLGIIISLNNYSS